MSFENDINKSRAFNQSFEVGLKYPKVSCKFCSVLNFFTGNGLIYFRLLFNKVLASLLLELNLLNHNWLSNANIYD